jgi:hypothetical protein
MKTENTTMFVAPEFRRGMRIKRKNPLSQKVLKVRVVGEPYVSKPFVMTKEMFDEWYA